MTNDPTSLCLDCSDHKLDCQCKDGARLPPAHTTTPWKCEKYEGDDADDNCKYIVMECKQSAIVAEIPVCCGWEEANAEHIVKCVNMHDELLDMCEECYMDEECMCEDLGMKLPERCRCCVLKELIAHARG
jgi:hypothetical protein